MNDFLVKVKIMVHHDRFYILNIRTIIFYIGKGVICIVQGKTERVVQSRAL